MLSKTRRYSQRRPERSWGITGRKPERPKLVTTCFKETSAQLCQMMRHFQVHKGGSLVMWFSSVAVPGDLHAMGMYAWEWVQEKKWSEKIGVVEYRQLMGCSHRKEGKLMMPGRRRGGGERERHVARGGWEMKREREKGEWSRLSLFERI